MIVRLQIEQPHFAGKSERNPTSTERTDLIIQSFELRQYPRERLYSFFAGYAVCYLFEIEWRYAAPGLGYRPNERRVLVSP
jgi:hypothetical protein